MPSSTLDGVRAHLALQALKYDFAGYWSRRITDEHRLVYNIHGEAIRIAACRYHYG